jgi:hypothetical protein
MKIKSINHLSEKFEECDITTSTENFYINTGSVSFLIHNSPAIVAGVDVNGRFFVGTKSVFNKEKEKRKISYSKQEIDHNFKEQPELAEKLNLALDYLPSLNLTGIYQMDFMFDNRIKKLDDIPKTIDGVKNENRFITFQPNPSGIKYAVSPDSPYGQQILNSKIGVAIHIKYKVIDGILKIEKTTSSPDEFSPSKTVFVFNVLVDKPKNTSSKFGKLLLRDVQKKKKTALILADSVDFSGLANYIADLKTYINTEVNSGRFLEDPKMSADKFINYKTGKIIKEIEAIDKELEDIDKEDESSKKDKRRSNRVQKKANKAESMKKLISELKALKPSIIKAFKITRLIAVLKNNLIIIFNEITKNDLLGTYVEDPPNSGMWQTVHPEGYALSKSDDITKMVIRVGNDGKPGFSQRNFNARAAITSNPTV